MKFFKIFWAALLACIVSGVVGFVLWLVVLLAAVGSLGTTTTTTISPNSILKITLAENFTEAPSSDPFAQLDLMTMEVRPSLTLFNILKAIEAAADDDNIEGILLQPNINPSMGMAALEEIRAALEDFKKSGKFIIAYSDVYTQGGYYLSTVADKVYVQPEGMIIWQGMASNTMFYKRLLDKLDISVEVFRPTECRYKSAVEPYIMDKMSDANRSQMQQLMGSMWSVIAGDVALARGLTVDQVNKVADDLICMDVDDALSHRMVDGLIYQDQLPELFREAGADIADEDQDIEYINFADYVAASALSLQSIGADKVAIIYAEGNIVDGTGSENSVYGDSTAEVIRKARYDDNVKAVVFRVNSPGGSALASDVMWRELELLRKEKPLIVSMGSYAASGGYYISAPADAILANRLTLTGSIGVFGMMPNIEKSLSKNIGITMDGVKTNRSADFMSSLDGVTPLENSVMIKSVDKVYERFTSLVSKGRNLPLSDVLEIAQGRVWSGTEALDNGLVDNIGGLRSAITLAITRAGIEDDYRIVEMTGEPTGIAALFSEFQALVSSSFGIKSEPLYEEYKQIKSILEPLNTEHGLLMYSPYRVALD